MDYMGRALELARRALEGVSPNPAVGAVVVRDGIVVGEGHTQPPGGPHAEVVALRQAGQAAHGATLYVTLEPCCHYGRTPPCTEAIIAAHIAEVRMAIRDPDPQVDGKGRSALATAGIRVHLGDGELEARRLNEAYIKQRTTGLPFVIAKFAASLDGRIAAASGDSRWVSSPAAREWAHRLRAQVDAIAVGVNTVLVDNPLLTARPHDFAQDKPAGADRSADLRPGEAGARQPLRVVVDSRGRTPATARVLSGAAPTLIATTGRSTPAWRQAMEAAGAEVVVLPERNGRVDLPALLRELGQRGVLSLLVEGGGLLLGSFFDDGLVDKVTAIIAPMVIGAARAPTAVAGRGARRLADALPLTEVEVQRLGEDILVVGRPARSPAAGSEAVVGRRRQRGRR